MSERDGDDAVARRYRELRREVPSAALDVKVLAAARSAVAPPSFARRWAAPLSAAAVLILAAGVTLQLQHPEGGPSAVQEEAVQSRAKKAAAPASPAPTPQAESGEIPFAPRRPAEPLPASPQSKSPEGKTEAAAAPARGAPNPLARGVVTPSAPDLARAQREAADAVRGFGLQSPAAGASAANAAPASGPFSIDQATTAGVQVRIVEPR